MTCAVAHLVVDKGVVVHVLCFVCYYAAVAPTLGTLALKLYVEAIACNTIVQCNNVVVETLVALLLHIHVRYACVLDVCLLHTIEVERCILSNVSLYHLCCKELMVVCSMVAE